MKISKINGSTFTIKKRGFDIDDVICIVSGLLMSVITIIITIRSVKYILLSLPMVIVFVYILLGVSYIDAMTKKVSLIFLKEELLVLIL